MRRHVFSITGAWSVTAVSLSISVMLGAVFFLRERRSRQAAVLAREQQRALQAERLALEAQLRMLQAQIEPHFLYNTLANAVGLIEPAPQAARQLLERLIDYLRASLQASRADTTTLGRELDMLRAYLSLMAVRMGPRLRYRVEADAAVNALPLPPMLLQPLVENALQHGLEPKIEGGEVVVEARVDDGLLTLVVADSGKGFDTAAPPRPGGGVGLANLRARLAALHGGAARLAIADRPGGGTVVTLHLPVLAPAEPGKALSLSSSSSLSNTSFTPFPPAAS